MRTLPPFPSLRSFLDHCAEAGEFQPIPEPVSIRHQMSAVHRAVLERGGPVLRFDAPVSGTGARLSMPVVTNLFGTTERVAALSEPVRVSLR